MQGGGLMIYLRGFQFGVSFRFDTRSQALAREGCDLVFLACG